MQQIVLQINGQPRQVLIGFDVLAFVRQGVDAGDFRADGYPVNPGQQIVDLLYVAIPDFEYDWRWYAEQASYEQVTEMFAARSQILEAVAERLNPAVPPAAEDVGSDEWKERMGVKNVN